MRYRELGENVFVSWNLKICAQNINKY